MEAPMRKGLLVALCGGALMFAYGAYSEGSRIQALVMLAVVFVVMGLSVWYFRNDKDDDDR